MAHKGGQAALNDAKTLLRIDAVEGNTARAVVVQGGEISPRKGITILGGEGRTETLNLRDQAMLDAARPFPFAQYAISYIRDAAEMERYRALFPAGAALIAKLERESAVRDAVAIARHADALWLCRGDLGAELGMLAMAEAVHDFAGVVSGARVPVFMAGQVLEHMVDHSTPTRSEVCFLYDSLRAGYAGVILSDECAVGKYPVEAVTAAAMFQVG
jgi:pyruvate kinase